MPNRFKKARTELNKNGHESVKEVFKATGITGSLIDDLETDTATWEKWHKAPRDVGYSKIKTLAEHYGVSSDYLLGLSNQPTIDAQAAGAAEYTGLSLEAIKRLKDADDNETNFISFLIENGISNDISSKAYDCAINKSFIVALDKQYGTFGKDRETVRKMIRESDDVSKAFVEAKQLEEHIDTCLWRCHKILESAVESFIDYVLEGSEKNGKR